MDSHSQANVAVDIFNISELLLADVIQEHECNTTDGMSIVHALLTKSTPSSRFMSTPNNIVHQQHRHNGFHQSEIKLIMGEKTDLGFQFSTVVKKEKTNANVPSFLVQLQLQTLEIIQHQVG